MLMLDGATVLGAALWLLAGRQQRQGDASRQTLGQVEARAA